jgi:hypothetical protein
MKQIKKIQTKQHTKKSGTDKFGIKFHHVNMWINNFKRSQFINTRIELFREEYIVKLFGTQFSKNGHDKKKKRQNHHILIIFYEQSLFQPLS